MATSFRPRVRLPDTITSDSRKSFADAYPGQDVYTGPVENPHPNCAAIRTAQYNVIVSDILRNQPNSTVGFVGASASKLLDCPIEHVHGMFPTVTDEDPSRRVQNVANMRTHIQQHTGPVDASLLRAIDIERAITEHTPREYAFACSNLLGDCNHPCDVYVLSHVYDVSYESLIKSMIRNRVSTAYVSMHTVPAILLGDKSGISKFSGIKYAVEDLADYHDANVVNFGSVQPNRQKTTGLIGVYERTMSRLKVKTTRRTYETESWRRYARNDPYTSKPIEDYNRLSYSDKRAVHRGTTLGRWLRGLSTTRTLYDPVNDTKQPTLPNARLVYSLPGDRTHKHKATDVLDYMQLPDNVPIRVNVGLLADVRTALGSDCCCGVDYVAHNETLSNFDDALVLKITVARTDTPVDVSDVVYKDPKPGYAKIVVNRPQNTVSTTDKTKNFVTFVPKDLYERVMSVYAGMNKPGKFKMMKTLVAASSRLTVQNCAIKHKYDLTMNDKQLIVEAATHQFENFDPELSNIYKPDETIVFNNTMKRITMTASNDSVARYTPAANRHFAVLAAAARAGCVDDRNFRPNFITDHAPPGAFFADAQIHHDVDVLYHDMTTAGYEYAVVDTALSKRMLGTCCTAFDIYVDDNPIYPQNVPIMGLLDGVDAVITANDDSLMVTTDRRECVFRSPVIECNGESLYTITDKGRTLITQSRMPMAWAKMRQYENPYLVDADELGYTDQNRMRGKLTTYVSVEQYRDYDNRLPNDDIKRDSRRVPNNLFVTPAQIEDVVASSGVDYCQGMCLLAQYTLAITDNRDNALGLFKKLESIMSELTNFNMSRLVRVLQLCCDTTEETRVKVTRVICSYFLHGPITFAHKMLSLLLSEGRIVMYAYIRSATVRPHVKNRVADVAKTLRDERDLVQLLMYDDVTPGPYTTRELVTDFRVDGKLAPEFIFIGDGAYSTLKGGRDVRGTNVDFTGYGDETCVSIPSLPAVDTMRVVRPMFVYIRDSDHFYYMAPCGVLYMKRVKRLVPRNVSGMSRVGFVREFRKNAAKMIEFVKSGGRLFDDAELTRRLLQHVRDGSSLFKLADLTLFSKVHQFDVRGTLLVDYVRMLLLAGVDVSMRTIVINAKFVSGDAYEFAVYNAVRQNALRSVFQVPTARDVIRDLPLANVIPTLSHGRTCIIEVDDTKRSYSLISDVTLPDRTVIPVDNVKRSRFSGKTLQNICEMFIEDFPSGMSTTSTDDTTNSSDVTTVKRPATHDTTTTGTVDDVRVVKFSDNTDIRVVERLGPECFGEPTEPTTDPPFTEPGLPPIEPSTDADRRRRATSTCREKLQFCETPDGDIRLFARDDVRHIDTPCAPRKSGVQGRRDYEPSHEDYPELDEYLVDPDDDENDDSESPSTVGTAELIDLECATDDTTTSVDKSRPDPVAHLSGLFMHDDVHDDDTVETELDEYLVEEDEDEDDVVDDDHHDDDIVDETDEDPNIVDTTPSAVLGDAVDDVSGFFRIGTTTVSIERDGILRNPEVIVNAANPKLEAGSGLSGFIFSKCGDDYETRLHVEYPKPLVCSQALYTTTKNNLGVPIIHAVGPSTSVQHIFQRKLTDTLHNVLTAAIKNGHKTVNLPLISCGIYAEKAGVSDPITYFCKSLSKMRDYPIHIKLCVPSHQVNAITSFFNLVGGDDVKIVTATTVLNGDYPTALKDVVRNANERYSFDNRVEKLMDRRGLRRSELRVPLPCADGWDDDVYASVVETMMVDLASYDSLVRFLRALADDIIDPMCLRDPRLKSTAADYYYGSLSSAGPNYDSYEWAYVTGAREIRRRSECNDHDLIIFEPRLEVFHEGLIAQAMIDRPLGTQHKCRVAGIVGPPGTGKTYLIGQNVSKYDFVTCSNANTSKELKSFNNVGRRVQTVTSAMINGPKNVPDSLETLYFDEAYMLLPGRVEMAKCIFRPKNVVLLGDPYQISGVVRGLPTPIYRDHHTDVETLMPVTKRLGVHVTTILGKYLYDRPGAKFCTANADAGDVKVVISNNPPSEEKPGRNSSIIAIFNDDVAVARKALPFGYNHSDVDTAHRMQGLTRDNVVCYMQRSCAAKQADIGKPGTDPLTRMSGHVCVWLSRSRGTTTYHGPVTPISQMIERIKPEPDRLVSDQKFIETHRQAKAFISEFRSGTIRQGFVPLSNFSAAVEQFVTNVRPRTNATSTVEVVGRAGATVVNDYVPPRIVRSTTPDVTSLPPPKETAGVHTPRKPIRGMKYRDERGRDSTTAVRRARASTRADTRTTPVRGVVSTDNVVTRTAVTPPTRVDTVVTPVTRPTTLDECLALPNTCWIRSVVELLRHYGHEPDFNVLKRCTNACTGEPYDADELLLQYVGMKFSYPLIIRDDDNADCYMHYVPGHWTFAAARPSGGEVHGYRLDLTGIASFHNFVNHCRDKYGQLAVGRSDLSAKFRSIRGLIDGRFVDLCPAPGGFAVTARDSDYVSVHHDASDLLPMRSCSPDSVCHGHLPTCGCIDRTDGTLVMDIAADGTESAADQYSYNKNVFEPLVDALISKRKTAVVKTFMSPALLAFAIKRSEITIMRLDGSSDAGQECFCFINCDVCYRGDVLWYYRTATTLAMLSLPNTVVTEVYDNATADLPPKRTAGILWKSQFNVAATMLAHTFAYVRATSLHVITVDAAQAMISAVDRPVPQVIDAFAQVGAFYGGDYVLRHRYSNLIPTLPNMDPSARELLAAPCGAPVPTTTTSSTFVTNTDVVSSTPRAIDTSLKSMLDVAEQLKLAREFVVYYAHTTRPAYNVMLDVARIHGVRVPKTVTVTYKPLKLLAVGKPITLTILKRRHAACTDEYRNKKLSVDKSLLTPQFVKFSTKRKVRFRNVGAGILYSDSRALYKQSRAGSSADRENVNDYIQHSMTYLSPRREKLYRDLEDFIEIVNPESSDDCLIQRAPETIVDDFVDHSQMDFDHAQVMATYIVEELAPGVTTEVLGVDDYLVVDLPNEITATHLTCPATIFDKPATEREFFPPDVQTSRVPNLQNTARNFIRGINKRNADVPVYNTQDDPHVHARTLVGNLLEYGLRDDIPCPDGIHARCSCAAYNMLDSYMNDPIDINEDALRRWVDRLPPNKLNQLITKMKNDDFGTISDVAANVYEYSLKVQQKSVINNKSLTEDQYAQTIVSNDSLYAAAFSNVMIKITERLASVLDQNVSLPVGRNNNDFEADVAEVIRRCVICGDFVCQGCDECGDDMTVFYDTTDSCYYVTLVNDVVVAHANKVMSSQEAADFANVYMANRASGLSVRQSLVNALGGVGTKYFMSFVAEIEYALWILCCHPNVHYRKPWQTDASKFDKTQIAGSTEAKNTMYFLLGMSPMLFWLWCNSHEFKVVICRAFAAYLKIDYQHNSGDISTLVGNTLVNLMSLYTGVKCRMSFAQTIGDDSNFLPKVEKALDNLDYEAGDVANLVVKTIHKAMYFCGAFIIPDRTTSSHMNPNMRVVRDPVKVLWKVGQWYTTNDAAFAERFVSIRDTMKQWSEPGIRYALADAIEEQYAIDGLCTSGLAVIETVESLFRDLTSYLKCYGLPPNFVGTNVPVFERSDYADLVGMV